MASEIWVNTGACNHLLPYSTKPLHKGMLAYLQGDPLVFISGQYLFEY